MTAKPKELFAEQWTEVDQRQQQVAAPPFRFVAACDMPVKPVAWLIRSYIEEDALAVLYGPPGKGKSFFALDVSCCIATGTPFHGHDVKPGAVFYIAGEGHNGLARRLRAWAQHNNCDMPSLLFVSEAPTDLSSATNAAKVAEAVQQLADATGESPVLIVIDTMARNFGGDENSATDVGNFVRNADALRRHWKATVLIVHHSGKDGEKGARGSSALKGAADAEYEVSRSDEDKLIRLTPRKMKDAEEPPPLAFELVGVPVRDDTGELVGGAALKLTEYTAPAPAARPQGKNQQKALEVLHQMREEIAARLAKQGREDHPINVLFDDWKARCEDAGMDRNRAKEACEGLQKRGVVERDGPHALPGESVRRKRNPLGTSDISDACAPDPFGQIGQESDENRTETGQAAESPDFEEF